MAQEGSVLAAIKAGTTGTSAKTPIPLAPSPHQHVRSRRVYNGCSSIKTYEIAHKLGEGTFGEVYQARKKTTGAVMALKKILMHNEKDGFPITALREIKLLKLLDHINVIRLEEMAIERNSVEMKKRAILYMVTPYMEHDLAGLLDNPDVKTTEPQIKCYMQQLFRGLEYLHKSSILHRDMKAANLLISNRGVLKIADFGLARHYEGRPPQPGRGGSEAVRDYTGLVVTRWYRPPELLLNLRRYTTAIDMWGAGCVFGEMFKRHPILRGQSDLHQLQIIFELIGTPTEENMPGWNMLPGAAPVKEMQPTAGNIDRQYPKLSKEALSLLKSLLMLDWRKRINATDALDHPYFRTAPLPARPEDIPKYSDSHELDRRNHRPAKQNLPPAPQGGAVGGGAHGDWAGEEARASNGGRWRDDRDRHDDRRDNRHHHGPHHHDRRNPGGHRDRDDRERGHGPSRVPQGAHERLPNRRLPAWQSGGNNEGGSGPARHNGTENGHSGRSSLPPPPADGRHQLPIAPHRSGGAARPAKPAAGTNPETDTYIPDYAAGSNNRRDERREDRPSRDRSLERGTGGDSRRDDRHWRERDRERERRPRDEYRDTDRAGGRDDGERRYRERDRDRDWDRERERERDRDRERGGGRRQSSRSASPVHRDRERDRGRDR